MKLFGQEENIMPKKNFYKLSDEKKNSITKAAIEAFREHNYQDISINKLIEKMGISTGSFYLYFNDKKDLYFYILSLFLEDIRRETGIEHKKIDITDLENNLKGSEVLQKFEHDPLHKAIFIDNFNNAPPNIKRDWDFEKLIGENYLDLYDYSMFENPAIRDEYRENKELLMAMFISINSVVEQFVPFAKNHDEYIRLFSICHNIIHDGITRPV